MSKLTKKALKKIVKECILEILQEGLGKTTLTAKKEDDAERKFQQKIREDRLRKQKEYERNLVEHAAGGDSIMANILQHTLKETIPEQTANEIPTARNQMPTEPTAIVTGKQYKVKRG